MIEIKAFVLLVTIALAGPLDPPAGPIAPTPGPEPRIAINDENTPGDFFSTFKITEPGSYYLEGNLIGEVNKDGIQIAADNVTVDLNGFHLLGAGPRTGITDGAKEVANVRVLNGTVTNWLTGVNLAFSTGVHVGHVNSTDNTGGGISIGRGSLQDCFVLRNGSIGVKFNDGVAVRCISKENGLDGFQSTRGIIRDCESISNRIGILITGGAVHDCYLYGNTSHGIHARGDTTVRNNTCIDNGAGGAGAGILVSSGDNRVEGNNCIGADYGIKVDGTGNVIIGNTCSDNTTNWEIIAGNAYGPITVTPSGAAVSGDTAAGAINSNHPWANFTY